MEVLEAEAELKARKTLLEKALSNRSTSGAQISEPESTSAAAEVRGNSHVEDQATKETNEAALTADTLKIDPSQNSFVSHVPLPDERLFENPSFVPGFHH